MKILKGILIALGLIPLAIEFLLNKLLIKINNFILERKEKSIKERKWL